MSKSNLNIVVFEEDSTINQHSRAQTKQAGFDGYSSNQPHAVIESQLGHLNSKISQLQEQTDKIQQLIRNSQISPSLTDINTSINANIPSNSHIEELLRVVQHKVQLTIQETQKIMQKMSGEFEKKLSKAVMQKNHEVNSITKIQAHCRDSLTKAQQNYQEQINIMRVQHNNIQKTMLQRVQKIETEYRKKLRDFQNKQQQYIATIQQLQNKLRLLQNAKPQQQHPQQLSQQHPSQQQQQYPSQQQQQYPSQQQQQQQYPSQQQQQKRGTDASQEKTHITIHIPSHRSINNGDNVSNTSSQIGSSNALPGETSKRRTRIFDKATNRSISPNANPHSPIRNQNFQKNQTQSLINPPGQQQQQRQASTVVPLSNVYQTHEKPTNYHIKATVLHPEQSYRNTYNHQQVDLTSKVQSEKGAPRYQTENVGRMNVESVRGPIENTTRNSGIENTGKTHNIKNRDTQKTVGTPTNQKQAPSEKQFLKDAPKPQWQRFQDFNDQQSSGSEEDVFFYPQHNTQKQQPKSVFDYANNSGSMHSPFDIN